MPTEVEAVLSATFCPEAAVLEEAALVDLAADALEAAVPAGHGKLQNMC